MTKPFTLISLAVLLVGLAAAAPFAPTAQDTTPANPATAPQPRNDLWWTQRNDSFNARARQGSEQGDIDVIFLGDSITQGWEDAGKDVWAATYAKRNAVNFGIGGDRTQHVLWRIEHGNLDGLAQPQLGHAPKLVVLMIGTNNTGSESAEQIAEGIDAIIDRIRDPLPTTKVLLLGVFPREETAAGTLRQKTVAINAILANTYADKERIKFLDIGAAFIDASKEFLPDGISAEAHTLAREIMPDMLHLSPKGYQVWADAMEETIREMLGEQPSSAP